ncbi:hypothetical protein JW933_01875 [candidate division FCPU426 bacterium]|nr:hypothetical protein [candidate division FCPU426 bacterium]
MRGMKKTGVAVLLLCIVLWPAGSQARPRQGSICLGLQGQLAQAWFSDLNKMIRDQDCAFITSEPNEALHEAWGGFVLGADAAYVLTEEIMLGINYEALFPNTELRIGSWAFPDRVYGIYLDAQQLGVTAKYLWPQGDSSILHAGTEVFYLQLGNAREVYKERVILSAMNTLERLSYQGATVGFKVSGGADVFVFTFLSVNGEAGFRYARIGKVTGTWLDGTEETLKNADGSDFSLDYSGFFIKGGIKFWL